MVLNFCRYVYVSVRENVKTVIGPRQTNLVLIAYASSESRQNVRCSLIQAVSQVEPSDRKPDPWPL